MKRDWGCEEILHVPKHAPFSVPVHVYVCGYVHVIAMSRSHEHIYIVIQIA